MKYIASLILGVLFGVTLYWAEVISWDRIHEMFTFGSFHMYGVIGSAIITGIVLRLLAKKIGIKTIEGKELPVFSKKGNWRSLLFGGIIFGMGWAITGACPGPLFIHLGAGNLIFVIVILAAFLGAFVYGMLRNKLPH